MTTKVPNAELRHHHCMLDDDDPRRRQAHLYSISYYILEVL